MRYASRKFLLALAACASATTLVVVGAIADAVYAAVMGTCVASYIAGNVAQKGVIKE
jgi:hypothetical protein